MNHRGTFIFIVSILSFTLTVNGQTIFDVKHWNNIVPLISTRKLVEEKFGQPNEPNCVLCSYKIKEGELTVLYSEEPCLSIEKGWNVEKDTVLEYYIDLGEGIEVDSEFSKKSAAVNIWLDRYLLPDTGVSYEEILKGKITKIKFEPKAANNDLRCKGFPQYDPVSFSYIPWSETGKIEEADVFIDLLLVNTESIPNTTGYILVYAPKEMSQTNYEVLFSRLENHLAARRITRPDSMKLVKAGRRTEFVMESFIMQNGAKPPTPRPDFPSVEFQ
jgi:hypothetical protein